MTLLTSILILISGSLVGILIVGFLIYLYFKNSNPDEYDNEYMDEDDDDDLEVEDNYITEDEWETDDDESKKIL